MSTTPVLAVIIARGGSRRLPRKNVRPFCGVPLVAWSVVQAKCSHLIDEVFVSTDDDEISAISLEYGAKVIRRPDWPDADLVAANRVYLHAIDYLEPVYGMDYTMVQLFPTSPCRLPDDIDRGIRMRHELGVHRVLQMARRRETFLYRGVHPNVVRFTLGDKYKEYYDQASVINVCSPRWYREFVGKMPTDKDKDLDAMLKDPMPKYCEVDYYYFEGKQWQMCETDTLEEFEFAEVVMDHYVTHGRGLEVYYEYARSKEAVV
jgi:CMP-N-acetylneuraminic acid synthetase